MSLKRLSGLFQRKDKRLEEQQREAEHEEIQEQRQSLIGEMSESFQSMGSTMEQVQDHLQSSTEAMQHLPALIQEQQALYKQVAIAQESNQGLLLKVQEYFSQRDQAQEALVDHVSAINQRMQDDAQEHRQQLQSLVSSYRSGRRMLVATVIFLGFIGTCLLALLLTVALRPDLLGVHSYANMNNSTNHSQASAQLTPSAPATSEMPPNSLLLREAQDSTDPLVRQRALQAH